jgi:hypothetical protein
VGGAAFSLRLGGKYLEAGLKDSNKKWVKEWFVVANLVPGLPSETGFLSVPNTTWEEKPSDEEMVQVEVLLAQLLELKATKLIGLQSPCPSPSSSPADPGESPPGLRVLGLG